MEKALSKEKPAKAVPKEKKEYGERRLLSSLKMNLIFYGVVAIVVVIFLKFVLVPGSVSSGSMSPTINSGDYIVANGLAYLVKSPQRGDVVCFKSDEFNEMMVKRIIGLPGDEISFRDGYVCINGEVQYEPYINPSVETNSPKTFSVPDGSYFMLGDNREDSLDSRFWDNPYISRDKIIGKYFYTMFHSDK